MVVLNAGSALKSERRRATWLTLGILAGRCRNVPFGHPSTRERGERCRLQSGVRVASLRCGAKRGRYFARRHVRYTGASERVDAAVKAEQSCRGAARGIRRLGLGSHASRPPARPSSRQTLAACPDQERRRWSTGRSACALAFGRTACPAGEAAGARTPRRRAGAASRLVDPGRCRRARRAAPSVRPTVERTRAAPASGDPARDCGAATGSAVAFYEQALGGRSRQVADIVSPFVSPNRPSRLVEPNQSRIIIRVSGVRVPPPASETPCKVALSGTHAHRGRGGKDHGMTTNCRITRSNRVVHSRPRTVRCGSLRARRAVHRALRWSR